MEKFVSTDSFDNVKIVLSSFAVAIFMLLNFVSYMFPLDFAGYTNFLLAICVLGVYLIGYGRYHSSNIWMIILICFIAFASILVLNSRFERITHFIVPFYNVLLAFVVINKRIYLKPLCIVYYLIALYVVCRVMVFGTDPDEVFTYASRNMISTIAIMYAVLIYLLLFLNNNKIIFLPALLAFLLSAIAIGRSGIICSLLLVVGVIFYKYKYADRKQKKWYIGGIFLVAGGIVYFFYNMFSGEELEFISRLQVYGLNDPTRAELLDRYIENLDFYNFLRGYDIMNDFIYNSWNNNPHNSWIYLHYNLGIWGVVLALLIFISGLKFFFKKYYFIVLLLGVVILRSATDSILFFTSYDFIIYSFIILAFTMKSRMGSKNIEQIS